MSMVTEYLRKVSIKRTMNERFQLSPKEPPVGARCIFSLREDKGNPVYFGKRTSQNFLRTGDTTIPYDQVLHIIWMKGND